MRAAHRSRLVEQCGPPAFAPVASLASLFSVFMDTGVEMVRAEEIATKHIKGIFVQLNFVFRQLFPKKFPHQLAASPTRLCGAVVERLWMRRFQ